MAEPYVPRPHDRTGIDRLVAQPFLALFADPGLGKSGMVLAAMRELRERFEAERVLIVAPLAVVTDGWPDEIAKWEEFRGLRVATIHGTPKKRLAAIESDADVYLINPEGLPWLEEQTWRWPDVLVVDESTRFRHIRTGHVRALRKLLPRFSRRYILTGTPTPKGLLDLFWQIYIVDRGAALGKSMRAYKERWFYPEQAGPWVKWLPRVNADVEIAAAIAPICLRMDSSEIKNLPPVLTTEIKIKLPPEARELYDRFRRDKLVEFSVPGAEDLIAANAGILSSKLRQIANGRVYVQPEDPSAEKLVKHIHSAKDEALSRLVDELGGKAALIGYTFDPDLDGIRAALGDTPVLCGKTPDKERSRLIQAWKRGDLERLAIHPKVFSLGLNLQDGGHVFIWYSLPWDPEQHDQAIKRIHRSGQKERVLVYRLLMAGTVDTRVVQVLDGRDRDQAAFLRMLHEEIGLQYQEEEFP